MKYSQQIGIVAVLALAAVAFIPWVYIPVVNITVTGLSAPGTDFGKPALLGLIFGFVSIILFLLPKIGAKRTNVFIGAINFSWAIRNFILVTACHAGDCPEKKAGIFLQLFFTLVILVMALLPKIAIPQKKD